MKFPVLWSGLGCCSVKCSEILAHIELSKKNPRVNKVTYPILSYEDANVGRSPARDRVRPKYLEDYVTGEYIDEAIDDTANCTIDFCYRLANVPQSYQDAISFPETSK